MKKYKSGFVFGKFYGFHMGHKFLADTALQNCEKVTILICSLPSEKIPGDLRYEWIKEIYKDNPKAIVKWMHRDVPQYPEEHPYFWTIWTKIANEYCPDMDILFTSELYGEIYSKYIGVKHQMVDLERKNVPICATNIRNDPFSNWEFIPDVVKPYFTKRIAIMGPESTGKSTLTEKLSNYYNTEFVEEYGRVVYERNGNKVTIDDFIPISIGRQQLEDEKLKKANKILFCDTEDITTYYLSKEYCGDDYLQVKDWFEDKIGKSKKYDIYLLLQPDCEWVQDGTRSFNNIRWEQYDIIKNHLIKNECYFIEIFGNWDERFSKSINILNGILFNM